MAGGRATMTEGLPTVRERVRRDLARLPAETTALHDPHSIPVTWSDELAGLTERLSAQLTAEAQSL